MVLIFQCQGLDRWFQRIYIWRSYSNAKDWIDCFKECLFQMSFQRGFLVHAAQFDDVVEELIPHVDISVTATPMMRRMSRNWDWSSLQARKRILETCMLD